MRAKWLIDFVKNNYHNTPDRDLAKQCNVNYVTIFNIRKKYSLERSAEFNKARRILSGHKGGTSTHKVDRSGVNNGNWKNGRSKNNTYYTDRQNKKYPHKYRARRKVVRAIEFGRLKRDPCVICNNPKSQAHHEDYSKPFDIIWLCQQHHNKLHHNKLSVDEMKIIDKEKMTFPKPIPLYNKRIDLGPTKRVTKNFLLKELRLEKNF